MSDQLALFIDFENVAIWADGNFFDLELGSIMKYLQSRGAVVVKRAYGDWSRFAKYRDDLVENSIDLVQLYSVRAGKNRADIRLALDAFETAINRPQITTIAIVSGDSDFGALASKLREYGRYIIGIGPRAITHQLLIKSCDEFIYLETILGQEPEPLANTTSERETARSLLREALASHGKRSELPILGTKLKQTMLSMDPTFNEANLGHGQFRGWLEDNSDIVNLFFRGLQMYVAPLDFEIPEDVVPTKQQSRSEKKQTSTPQISLSEAYADLFSKVFSIDVQTRRDVLRDIYSELSEHPDKWSPDTLLDQLQSRYEARSLSRSKTLLRKVFQLGFTQRCYEYNGDVSVNSPVKLAQDIECQTTFIRRAESNFPYAVIKMGLDLDRPEMAARLLEDRTQTGYIQDLLDDLQDRELIVQAAGRYHLPGYSQNPLLDDPNLKTVIRELKAVSLPNDLGRDVETARELAKKAMGERTNDFSTASHDLLWACRIQWDAFERGDPEATLDELRWYIASYASVEAGELAQVHGQFTKAQPHYLAFFSLVQEDTPLWNRMRGLINPMLSYYWRNLGREMEIELDNSTSPVRVAIQIVSHPNMELHNKWLEATKKLASINPNVLRRLANHMRLAKEDSQMNLKAAEEIEGILMS